MTWAHPFELVLIPVVVIGAWMVFRRAIGGGDLSRLQNVKRLWADRQGLKAAPAVRRRRARGVLLGLGLIGAVLALARPQWGNVEETTYDHAREVLIALDLSRSMLADDVTPTRLARAKLLVESLLDQLHGERVGLVVFAGTSFLQSPLSADYEVLRDFLTELQPSYMPQGGTDYQSMLTTGLKAFGQEGEGDRYLIVLSDGEAHDEQWKETIPALTQRGIRVIGLGVGTEQGSVIPDESGGLMKDESGAAVLSKLEPKTLQELAEATGGTYRDAATWVDLADVVQQTVDQGRKGRYVEEKTVRFQDRFQWFLAPAVLILMMSYWLELPVFPIARTVRRHKPGSVPAPGATAIVAVIAVAFAITSARAATPPAEEPAVNPLETVVGELAAKPDVSAADYAALAKTTIEVASQPGKVAQPARLGVLDDALAGVTAGEQIDAKAADWPALRQQLEALKQEKKEEPPQQEEKQQQQQQNKQNQSGQGESKQDQGGGGSQRQKADNQQQSGGQDQAQQNADKSQPQNDEQQQDAKNQPKNQNGGGAGDQQKPEDQSAAAQVSQGQSGQDDAGEEPKPDRADAANGSGENQPESSPQVSAGEKTEERKEPKALEGAGFGDLQQPTQPADSHRPQDEHEKQPATRMVGGGQPLDPSASGKDVALVESMNRIKDGDAPAVLFDRMNQAEGQRAPEKNGKNW